LVHRGLDPPKRSSLRQFQAAAQCGIAPWRTKAPDGDAFWPTLPNSSSPQIDIHQKQPSATR
jgi:hypothetical protein